MLHRSRTHPPGPFPTIEHVNLQDHSSEPPSAKGLAVFRDPQYKPQLQRTATSINWHPEGAYKIAVSYSVLTFQARPRTRLSSRPCPTLTSLILMNVTFPCPQDPRFATCRQPSQSYIWDINNPNMPEMELQPPSPLCCLRFNPKSTDILVGGCYNGLVTYFDMRKPGNGHREPRSTTLSVLETANNHVSHPRAICHALPSVGFV